MVVDLRDLLASCPPPSTSREPQRSSIKPFFNAEQVSSLLLASPIFSITRAL
jgi:hypothetical protein